MKNTILFSAAVLTAILFSSCNKDFWGKNTRGMLAEVSNYEHIVNVSTNDYERVEAQELVRTNDDLPYSAGRIEYVENGQVSASIDFNEGDYKQAKYNDKDGEKWVNLEKGKGKDSEYDKVIVEPLVKSESCNYIISGIIKFYQNKKWVATFDYGDNTCDDLITKTTNDGVSVFSMNDYPE